MDAQARILCTDDEDAIRNMIGAALRPKYEVIEASNGEEALAQLALHPDTAVIISDMRMPVMDGISLLSRASEQYPDVTRLLLTGQPELQTAIDAVNQGHVFRFLTKPVPVGDLRATVDAAVRQHMLVTAERVLLEQTLHGSIHALTDVMALGSPLAFGRANRLRELVAALNDALGLPKSWQVEVAAMLSQLAMITLPADTIERAAYGHDLSTEEQEMVGRLPEVTEQLLGRIPRLEMVRELLKASRAPAPWVRPADASDPVIHGAALLRLALAFDLLFMQGEEPTTAIALLHGRSGVYDPAMLAALERISGELMASHDLRELPLTEVKPGMVLLENLTLETGMLLVCGGATVTVGLLERLRNLPRGSVPEPIRVNVSRFQRPATP